MDQADMISARISNRFRMNPTAPTSIVDTARYEPSRTALAMSWSPGCFLDKPLVAVGYWQLALVQQVD